MNLGKKISGDATFTFDYFTNGGVISCECSKCLNLINLNIEIYKSGKLVEKLTNDLNENIIAELVKKKAINIRDEKNKWNSGLSKYVLWNMNAHYEIIKCSECKNELIAIFGMAELQPGREEVQYKGMWELIKST